MKHDSFFSNGQKLLPMFLNCDDGVNEQVWENAGSMSDVIDYVNKHKGVYCEKNTTSDKNNVIMCEKC